MEKGADEGDKIGGSGCVAQAQGQGQLRRQVEGRCDSCPPAQNLLLCSLSHPSTLVFGWACSVFELHSPSRLSLNNSSSDNVFNAELQEGASG